MKNTIFRRLAFLLMSFMSLVEARGAGGGEGGKDRVPGEGTGRKR